MNNYFDIDAPQNNVIRATHTGDLALAHDMVLAKTINKNEIHKVIPIVFEDCADFEDQSPEYHENFIKTLKDLISDFLQNKDSLPYLAIRTKLPADMFCSPYVNKHCYEHNRNNLLHSLVKITPAHIELKDIFFLKEIFTKTIEQGVSPLEKCIWVGFTPLASFLLNDLFPRDEHANFLKFLIDLHPNSLIDFSEKKDGAPIFSLLQRKLHNKMDPEEITRHVSLLTVIVEHMPAAALEKNYDYWHSFFMPFFNEKTKNAFSSITEHLNVKIEKHTLSLNIPAHFELLKPNSDTQSRDTISTNSTTSKNLFKI